MPFARELTHPVPLAAVFVLAVNDHWLKAAAPGLITGKLSDFAGLFFFPLLLLALMRLVLGSARIELAIAITGLVFTAAKTLAPVAAFLSSVWGTIVLDPTDLVALPMLALSYVWAARFDP